MKILNHIDFLKYEQRVIFSFYNESKFHDLFIKYETIDDDKFLFIALTDNIYDELSEEFDESTDEWDNKQMFSTVVDDTNKFVVYEWKDITEMSRNITDILDDDNC